MNSALFFFILPQERGKFMPTTEKKNLRSCSFECYFQMRPKIGVRKEGAVENLEIGKSHIFCFALKLGEKKRWFATLLAAESEKLCKCRSKTREIMSFKFLLRLQKYTYTTLTLQSCSVDAKERKCVCVSIYSLSTDAHASSSRCSQHQKAPD